MKSKRSRWNQHRINAIRSLCVWVCLSPLSLSVCKMRPSEGSNESHWGRAGLYVIQFQVCLHKRLLIEVKKWNVTTPLNKTDYSNYFKVCKLLILFPRITSITNVIYFHRYSHKFSWKVSNGETDREWVGTEKACNAITDICVCVACKVIAMRNMYAPHSVTHIPRFLHGIHLRAHSQRSICAR